jgi:tetratricopeptide (TPR) repeat protein
MIVSKPKLALLSILLVIAVFIWRMYQPDETLIRTNNKEWASESSTSVTPNADNVHPNFLKQAADLETYLVTNPTDTTHIAMLARLYQDGHKPDKAAIYFEQLLGLQTQNPQHWLDLVTVYGTLSQWKKAEDTCIRMLTYFPHNLSAKYNLGAIYANQNKLVEAKKIWNEVAASQSDEHVIHLARQGLEAINKL